MRVSSTIARGGLLSVTLVALGCSADFDTTRQTPPRGTLGRELFAVVCDRVGAQALREDVTGDSFRPVCHADPATGQYASKVDPDLLPPLYDGATTPQGERISLAQQESNRLHRIARIEALGRRREDLIHALDAAIPDIRIPIHALPAGQESCDPPEDGARDVGLHKELAATLGRMIDLYDDEEQTLPSVTRAFGRTLDDVKSDFEVQGALARFDARQGYRPIPTALGSIRPILGYPHLVDLTRSLISILIGDGEAGRAFREVESVAYDELRTPSKDASAALDSSPLGQIVDPLADGRAILTRPRTFLEGVREVLATEGDAFVVGPSDFIVRRDLRGYASVPTPNGFVPIPFLDKSGPGGKPDGLPDVDDLGQFITSDNAPAVSPFFSREGRDGARDNYGRAKVSTSDASLMYGYVDTRKTFLAALTRDIKPFFASDLGKDKETAMNALAALPVLAGTRDSKATAKAVYPPDPHAVDAWKLGHKAPPPAGLGTAPVSHAFRAFHPESSPIVDLMYALGQVLGAPEMDGLLAVAQKLFDAHPNELASLMGLALEVRSIAAKHPEAKVPDNWTFWDDALVQLARVSHEPGLLEDILRAFADPQTLQLEPVLAQFFSMKDDVSYDSNDLNGPSIDLDNQSKPPVLSVPVDRTQPDVGANRSEMQKFLSLLHDTNGLSICTKDGAVVHIKASQPVPLDFDYPTDPIFTPLMCGIVGATAPTHLPKCAVFGYTNVMTLLLDVLLGKALLEVNDPCLNKLMSSSIAQLAGGADHFLEMISGVQGFSLHPNLKGFARLLYFKTPYPYPGTPVLQPDPNPANVLTNNFLRDTIDPIPSMACDLDPFTGNGKSYPLRKCASTDDFLRVRDADALFPVDEFGFVPALQPLAKAFDKHHQPLLFADLWDVLHLHWGSPAQPPSVCDPSKPRTDARWCSQDGIVTYEPLLTEILQNGAFGRLQSFMATLNGIRIKQCAAFDPKTKECRAAVENDGIHVVSEALALMLDPARTPGLVDRQGNNLILRNDGQRTAGVSAMGLLANAFKGMDDTYATYANDHPDDKDRQTMWRNARSQLTDTFFAVDGAGDHATFKNKTVISIVSKVIALLREQVAAHCQPGEPCGWSEKDLTQNMVDAMSGPTFASLVDLADAVRKDDSGRAEVERLVSYLLDAASGNDAQVGVLASVLDALQILQDDTNLSPFKRILSRGLEAPVIDDAGKVVQRGLADSAIRSLEKIFESEAQIQGTGGHSCVKERDPNRAITVLLQSLVTPMAADEPSPIEVIMSVIGDVNRAAPEKTTKFDGADYGNVANEMSEFCLDGTRGLEQFYAVINQAIGH